jgi:predicted lipid-binding transport protein (Tim44 family)
MMRRFIVLLLTAVLIAPSASLAQTGGGGNPFGPLPPPQQAPPDQPEPQKIETDDGDDDGLGGTAFWLIIGTTGLIFAVVGFLITRDMRRTVGRRNKPKRRLRGTGRPAADAASALAGGGRHEPGSHKARAKAQQRAKTKAARKQRRKTRSR